MGLVTMVSSRGQGGAGMSRRWELILSLSKQSENIIHNYGI